MLITPTQNRVLVQLEPEYEGELLHLFEDSRAFNPVGLVVAVGPQVREVEVGDRVLIDHRAGQTRIPAEDGTMYVLCREYRSAPSEPDPIMAILPHGRQITVNVGD